MTNTTSTPNPAGQSEGEPAERYIVATVDRGLTPDQKQECREINRQVIREIRLTQRQVLFLINLLALELEDRLALEGITGEVLLARDREDGAGPTSLAVPAPAATPGLITSLGQKQQ